MVNRMIAKIVNFLRWLFASETLPTEVLVNDAQGIGAPRRDFTRWTLKADALDTAQPEGMAVVQRQRFLRWVFAAETFSAMPAEPAEMPKHTPRFWSWLICPENLPHMDGETCRPGVRTMFFARLLAAEACPEYPGGTIERREGSFRRLLAPETCPSQPPQGRPAKKGLARWLLKQEECPVDSTSAPVRRRGFWRNLFASEKL